MGTQPSSGLQGNIIDVSINGSPLSAAVMQFIEEATVDDSVELPSMFSFTVISGETLGEEIPWVDDPKFALGNSVEIKMGPSDALTSMIKGEITALEPEFNSSRLPILRVRGFDRRHRLQRGKKTRTFVQSKDSDIASQVAGAAGLSVVATDSKTTLDYVLQVNQTDWQFLCERARLIGYELAIKEEKLLFRPVANSQSATMTLSFGESLLEFSPRLSVHHQVSKVKVQGWSVKDKQALLGSSQAGDEVSKMGGGSTGAALAQAAFGEAIETIVHSPVVVQAEADQIAKGRFNNTLLYLLSAEGVCQGTPDLRAGIVITIAGVGKRFGGQYYVTGAVHRYTPELGYMTHFKVRRNAV
jgi:phage protein D